MRPQKHGQKHFLGAEEHLHAFARVMALAVRAGDLRESKDTKLQRGVAARVAGKRLGDGLGAGDAEVVHMVGPGGAWIVEVEQCRRKVGTVVGKPAVAVDVWLGVQMGHERQILLQSGFYLENVNVPDEG